MVKSQILCPFSHLPVKIIKIKFCKILSSKLRNTLREKFSSNKVVFLRTSAPELSELQLISAGGDVHSLFTQSGFGFCIWQCCT